MQYAYLSSRLVEFAVKNYAECPGRDKGQCENDCKLCKNSQSGYNCAGSCGGCLLGGSCDNVPTGDGVTLCSCTSGALNPRAGCCPVGWSLLTGADILRRKNAITGVKAGLLVFFDQNRGSFGDRSDGFYEDAVYEGSSVSDDSIIYNGFSVEDYENLWNKRLQSGCYPCPGTLTGLGLCDNTPDSNGDVQCSGEDSELTAERMWDMTATFDEVGNEQRLPGEPIDIAIQDTPWYYKPQSRPFPFGYPPTTQYSEYKEFNGYGPAVGRSIHDVHHITGLLADTEPLGYVDIETARGVCDMNLDCASISQIPSLGISSEYSGAKTGGDTAALSEDQCTAYAAENVKQLTILDWVKIFELPAMSGIVSHTTSVFQTPELCKDIADAKGYTYTKIGHIETWWSLADYYMPIPSQASLNGLARNSINSYIRQPHTIQYAPWTYLDWAYKVQNPGTSTSWDAASSSGTASGYASYVSSNLHFRLKLKILVSDDYYFLYHRYANYIDGYGGQHYVKFSYSINGAAMVEDTNMRTCTVTAGVQTCTGHYDPTLCSWFGGVFCIANVCTNLPSTSCVSGRTSAGELDVPSGKFALTAGQTFEIIITTYNDWYRAYQRSGFGFMWASSKHISPWTPVDNNYFGRSENVVGVPGGGTMTNWDANFDNDKFSLMNDNMINGCSLKDATFNAGNKVYWNHATEEFTANRFTVTVPRNCFVDTANDNDLYFNTEIESPDIVCSVAYNCLHKKGAGMEPITYDDWSKKGALIFQTGMESVCLAHSIANNVSVVFWDENIDVSSNAPVGTWCYELGTMAVVPYSGSNQYKVFYNQHEERKQRFYLFGEGLVRESMFHRSVVKRPNSNRVPYMNDLAKIFVSPQIASGACGGDINKCVPSLIDAERENPLGISLFQSRLSCESCAVSNIFNVYGTTRIIEGIERENYDLGHSYSSGCAKCLSGSGGKSAIDRIYDYCYPQSCASVPLNWMRFWDNWLDTYPDRDCNGLINSACKNGEKFKKLNDLFYDPGSGCSRCPAGSGFGYDYDLDGTIDDPQFNSNALELLNPTNATLYPLTNSYNFVGEGMVYAAGNLATTDPYIYLSGHGQMHNDIVVKEIQCRPCPVNTFSTKTQNCQDCPGLTSTKSQVGQTFCTLCGKGTFYAIDIVDATADKCVDCPAGMYVESDSKKADSQKVPAGWGIPTGYSTLPSWAQGLGGCDVCPAGKYNPYTKHYRCYDCPAGRFGAVQSWTASATRMPRSTMEESCTICAKGSYSSAGSTSCTSC